MAAHSSNSKIDGTSSRGTGKTHTHGTPKACWDERADAVLFANNVPILTLSLSVCVNRGKPYRSRPLVPRRLEEKDSQGGRRQYTYELGPNKVANKLVMANVDVCACNFNIRLVGTASFLKRMKPASWQRKATQNVDLGSRTPLVARPPAIRRRLTWRKTRQRPEIDFMHVKAPAIRRRLQRGT